MFSKFFTSDETMEIFAIATMILFFISFIVMLLWAFRIDKKKLEEYNNLPLENNKNFQDE